MRVVDNGQVELDGIDKIILNHLMNDAKVGAAVIAKVVGVSTTAIHQRIKKLEQSKLINSTKVYINPDMLGYNTTAFVGVYLDKSSYYRPVIKKMEEIPEVVEAHFTTGNHSIFVKLLCKDNAHLMEILNYGIQNIDGVNRTETFISLEKAIGRQIKL